MEDRKFLTRVWPVLMLVGIIGLVRGLFWVVLTPVWYAVDEAQHFAYIQHIAEGGGLPVVGEDFVSKDVLAVAKASPTTDWRTYPTEVTADDPEWGAFVEQYEAIQGPVYYLLMAPVLAVSKPVGIVNSIYVLRITTLLISLTAVPALFFLARELFPTKRLIWFASPAILVALQSFNSNLAAITNDAVLLPLSIVTLLVLVKAVRRGLTFKRCLIVGGLLGLSFLAKMTAIPLVAVAGVAVVMLPGPDQLGRRLLWGSGVAGVGLLVLSPWLIRNRIVYGTFSSTNTLEATTAPLQPQIPFTLKGLARQTLEAQAGFFQSQPYFFGMGRIYGFLISALVAAAFVIVMVKLLKSRSFDLARVLGWLGLSYPVALAAQIAVIYVFVGGLGTVVGRHLYAVLGVVVLLLVAGLVFAFGSRAGLILLLCIVATLFFIERWTIVGYGDYWYTQGILGDGLTPAVEQSYNDGLVQTGSIEVDDPPCRVDVIGLVIWRPAPSMLTVITEVGAASAKRFLRDHAFQLYRLSNPQAAGFRVELPAGTMVGRSAAEREPYLSFSDRDGDPTARLYCLIENPRDGRFAQVYDVHHPRLLSRHRVQLWASAWAIIGGGALLGAAITLGIRRPRLR